MRGRPPYGYLSPLKADLFLSANPDDVRRALEAGFPAARVYAKPPDAAESHPHEVRIAFDGDAVLFSDEAERVYQERGLPAFEEHERTRAGEPLPPGPMQPFLRALHPLQKNPPPDSAMRIRTALVTARSAPAHDRAVRTLMSWDIEVDEAMFLGGLDKGPFLRVFEPDFYFDDQLAHVQSASLAGPERARGLRHRQSDARFTQQIGLCRGRVLVGVGVSTASSLTPRPFLLSRFPGN